MRSKGFSHPTFFITAELRKDVLTAKISLRVIAGIFARFEIVADTLSAA